MNGKYRVFKQIKDRGMITIKCPECTGEFGLVAKFAEEVEDMIYHYSCPYCACKHSLKKD